MKSFLSGTHVSGAMKNSNKTELLHSLGVTIYASSPSLTHETPINALHNESFSVNNTSQTSGNTKTRQFSVKGKGKLATK